MRPSCLLVRCHLPTSGLNRDLLLAYVKDLTSALLPSSDSPSEKDTLRVPTKNRTSGRVALGEPADVRPMRRSIADGCANQRSHTLYRCRNLWRCSHGHNLFLRSGLNGDFQRLNGSRHIFFRRSKPIPHDLDRLIDRFRHARYSFLRCHVSPLSPLAVLKLFDDFPKHVT